MDKGAGKRVLAVICIFAALLLISFGRALQDGSSAKQYSGYAVSGDYLEKAKLTEIKVPDGTKKIGDNAFKDCTNLQTIELPESLEEIGLMAFANCSSLTTIKLPENVKKIGWGAFSGCTSLVSIELSQNLEWLPFGVFAGGS